MAGQTKSSGLRFIVLMFVGVMLIGGLSLAPRQATAASPNLALNTARTGYPNPLASDPGWGGGSYPWDMLDGQVSYTDTWAHGLAFTGGTGQWMGQPCGWRQATVDFGSPTTFNRILVWHHGTEHIPTVYYVDYWNGTAWVNVGGTSSVRTDLSYTGPGWASIPTENLFPTVTGSKVRFNLNNCNIEHGWIYEFEVFSDVNYRLPFAGGPYMISNAPSCSVHYGPDLEAIDYALPRNTPVLAAEAGRVIFADYTIGNLGAYVKIEHADGSISLYAHLLTTPPVRAGNIVRKGDVIGYSGATGNVRGPHLHFQVNDKSGNPISIRTLTSTIWYSGDPNHPCNSGQYGHPNPTGGWYDGQAVGPTP